jgi:serine/threonine protein kinase
MGVTFGKYEIIRRIATGGMAEIFLARERQIEGFERPVVIKKVLPQFAKEKELSQMFLQEARTAALLEHANIVRIYGLGQEQGIFYIAMEYVHGETLSEVWKRGVQRKLLLPLPYTLQLIADAAKGLDHAHKKKDLNGRPLQIVHRDVSPQNVMVSFEGVVKIVDFGIAKAANKLQATNAGIIKGKFAYMSPEQARGEPVDARSDIFALGILLYELTSGKRLFRAPSDVQTIQMVANADVMPPSKRIPQYPKGLEKIVMTALAAKPVDRFQDAKAFSDALEGYLRERRLETQGMSDYLKTLFPEQLEIDLNTTDAEGDGFLLPTPVIIPEREPVGLMTSSSMPVIEAGSALDVLIESGEFESQRPEVKEALPPKPVVVEAPPKPREPDPNAPQIKSLPQKAPKVEIPRPDLFDVNTPTPKGERQPKHTGHFLAEQLGIIAKPEDKKNWVALSVGLGMLAIAIIFGILYLPGVLNPQTAKKGGGSLIVNSFPPQAAIYIDNSKQKDLTPTQIPSLEVDTPYEVKITKEGFYPEVKQITIDPKLGTFSANFTLRAMENILVTIETSPPGANFLIDGVDSQKRTTARSYLAPGEKILTFELKGYETKQVTLNIPAGVKEFKPDVVVLTPEKVLDPSRTGKLSLIFTESVDIFVEDKQIAKGQRNVQDFALEAGSYTVKIIDHRGESFTFMVDIKAGEDAIYSHQYVNKTWKKF